MSKSGPGLLTCRVFITTVVVFSKNIKIIEIVVKFSAFSKQVHIDVSVMFDIDLCADLSVDAMDISGEQHIDVEHNIFKQRLNATGDVIPSAPEKES